MTLAARRELLARVLDALIPEGRGFPAAGAVALDHVLARAAASADLAARLSGVLDAVAAAAPDFAALSVEAREATLRRVEASAPEAFEVLVQHTYDGYYADAGIVERLGLDPRPPHPRGHPIDAEAPPDLSRVAARGALYRRAEGGAEADR